MSVNRKVKKNKKGIYFLIFILGFFISALSTTLILEGREDAIHISIVYSSEKASWMTIAYTNFIEEWDTNNPDIKIKIDMHPYGSSDSIISILNGEIFPTIWSPASSIWLPFLNTKWSELTGGGSIVNSESTVRIIYSPIVIATWESFNQTYEISGFQDLRDLNLNPSVTVRMAHTDPRLSNSGFMSVIMSISAASGNPTENLTMSDLTNQNNQLWLKEFESSAIIYGKSTGFLARYMESQGPSELNVAFLYENLIRDISSTAIGGKIIAIYPEEGTLYSDHPFSILDASWITSDQRMVADAFLNYLNQTSTIESALQYGFRPIDTSIPLDPEVFNYENNGIAFNINVPELKAPNDGTVLLKIPDLWLLCKATA
jgi:Ca-activated chloride channel family protein